jgi:hypothetical protein
VKTRKKKQALDLKFGTTHLKFPSFVRMLSNYAPMFF